MSVILAGQEYELAQSVPLSVALDLAGLATSEGSGDRMRAGAVALAWRCPALLPRLGLDRYRGDPWTYGGQVIDALADPSARAGKARQSSARATLQEITAACTAALDGAFDALRGTSQEDVDAAAHPTEPTP